MGRLTPAIVACALAFAHLPPAGAGELAGRVVKVDGGDTLAILDAGKQQRVIRLADVDAPEMAQRFGTRSRESLAGLCAGKTAQVEDRGLDAEGRTLGWVLCAGINANGEQVRRGMAWVDPHTAAPTSALYTLEGDARLARRGLWRDRRPVAPWVWRAASRPCDPTALPASRCRAAGAPAGRRR
jgi:endonuclease YncB( thermonuclease family)